MGRLKADKYQIIIDEDWSILSQFVQVKNYSSIHILVDENSLPYCYMPIKSNLDFDHHMIEITSGEKNKSLETCQKIWNTLVEQNCDRKSLVINLGGGVIGDMGGFCASTYMRGIDFIQIPTTLLSQVDASVGGKLGIDLGPLKNMVGVFNQPQLVWIHTPFLQSLEKEQLRSGFAEVIKHALIADEQHWKQIIQYPDLSKINNWTDLVQHSVEIKNKVVLQDPTEQGLRKILNYGHTLGHAIESHLLNGENSLLHGEAVAYGMILENEIAVLKGSLDSKVAKGIKNYIESIYGPFNVGQVDVEKVIRISRKDKKNEASNILMSIIDKIGNCQYNLKVEADEIRKVLT